MLCCGCTNAVRTLGQSVAHCYAGRNPPRYAAGEYILKGSTCYGKVLCSLPHPYVVAMISTAQMHGVSRMEDLPLGGVA